MSRKEITPQTKQEVVMLKPTHIVIHNSSTKDSGSVSWGAIRKYHKGQGWDDIGYHYGIELVGDSYEILIGRMPNIKGAHCRAGGMNNCAIGVCCVGDFYFKHPPPSLLDKCEELLNYLMELYSIPKENVIGHREVESKKTCPGVMFDMGKFRGRFK